MNVQRGYACLFALVLTTATITAQEKPIERKYIMLPRPSNAVQLPFSDAVLLGNTLYISGRLGIDAKTGTIPSDIDQEIKNLLDGFKAVLGEAKMGMENLVQVQVFCPDLSLYDKFNAASRSNFSKDFPARAFVGSGPLLR